MITVNVASQFSKHPAGRDNNDGPYNGTKFRRKFLLEPLGAGKSVSINFVGVRGYGSSFLDEAFGGLVRDGLDAEKLKKLIKIESNDQSLEIEIFSYIDDAV
ncbi:STAS-like domain-containing protein [Zhongshania sp.]|jgi:hypothetical protein|uniref:STAS-like domain-containing protein n=1 Tax=Zhongshania sp. TaxID=1971902 RepID=UPI0039C716D1